MISIEFSAAVPADATTVCLLMAKGGQPLRPINSVPATEIDLVRKAADASRFEGEAGTLAEQFVTIDGRAVRLVLIGSGQASNEDMEKAGSALTTRFLTSGETAISIDFSGLAIAPSPEATARFAAAIALRGWRYDTYRTRLPETQRPSLVKATLIGVPSGTAEIWARLDAVTAGVSLTRELVTEPANIIYPESFVARCRPLLEAAGVKIRVLGKAEMTAAGMGALLGVNQGSVREPQLLVMEWSGDQGAAKEPVVFVGKGVTFDTGGISLKPPAGMEDMKWDMGGAGAVAGAMLALAKRKAKARVVGICGLVENMPDGAAQRPGDVVTSMSGQTIEVINTDAEGRLVLCDAMTWVQKEYAPKVMIDLATLTGAMIVSLGFEYAGMFSNDDGLAESLLAAGKASGDPLWRFPLGAAYDKLIDSPIADMKNVGPREGGSITAAQFLQRYVDDGVKWAHLDIAGMVWAAKPGAVWDKGATGFGVRLLDQLVADNFES